jgi:uncharacterized protein (DUF3084 family)
MEEERRTEVIHEITYAPEESVEVEDTISSELDGIDLDDTRAIADYYMAKNNLIDADQLEVEKKEKELREEIEKIVDDRQALIDYLTNLHASIEVMEERIYELELKDEKKERQTVTPTRPAPLAGGRGFSSIPFGIF